SHSHRHNLWRTAVPGCIYSRQCELLHTSPQKNIAQTTRSGQGLIVCREEALDMIDMITTALDIGIMTSIVMLVAFSLALRRDAQRGGPHHDSSYRVYEDTP